MKIDDQYGRPFEVDDKSQVEMAQGYVRFSIFDKDTREVLHNITMRNTVVNDARRAAARNFSNTAPDFRVQQYRLGYSDVANLHWDAGNNKPVSVPFADNTPLVEYDGTQTVDYFHTQADIDDSQGKHFVGVGNPLDPISLGLSVEYPFNSDEYACRLFVELDGSMSAGATFDTVEVILANGWRFAARWTFPIIKESSWGLSVEHLCLF